MLETQRAAFFAELPVPLAVRRDRLRRAVALIEQNSSVISAALDRDHEHQDQASAMRTEIAPALAALRDSLRALPRWMRPSGGRDVLTRLLKGDDYVEYQPIGIVGLDVPAELPLLQLASLLAGALSAGNRVVIGFAPASGALAQVFSDLVPSYFDPLELLVAPEGATLADMAVDLVVTSATDIEPAAGVDTVARTSKSPVIIGRSADAARAANRVIASKLDKAGRMPLAPDYLLVPEDQEEAIAGWLWRAGMQLGLDAGSGAAMSDADKARLVRLIDDARARGGEVLAVEPAGGAGDQMPLHIIRHATADMQVMQEEIRGLILPLCNYRRIEDAISAVHRHGAPLAIYYFGRDRAERQQVLDRTLSATIAINGHALAMGGDAGTRRARGLALGTGQGEAAFRRFSRARHVYRHAMLDLARGAADGRSAAALP